MGRIEHESTRHQSELLPHHTIGRDVSCALHVSEGCASRLHAVLTWEGAGWAIRDLGSRNGTKRNGRGVAAGLATPVLLGDVLELGGPALRWRVVSDGPPRPAAVAANGVPAVFGWDDGFVLPNADSPELLIRRGEHGAWVAVERDAERVVVDGSFVTVQGVMWRVYLPVARPPTAAPEGGDAPRNWRLCIAVDEELNRVEATLFLDDNAGREHRFDLGTRAHIHVLLTLARERQRAIRRGVPPDEAGWVSPEDLRTHLDLSTNAFYVQLCRLRAQITSSGLLDPEQVIERRFTGELRVGTADITVSRVDQ